MIHVDITETKSLNQILRELRALISSTPVSVSLRGRRIIFRTEEELNSFITGFDVCWDILDDLSSLGPPNGSH